MMSSHLPPRRLAWLLASVAALSVAVTSCNIGSTTNPARGLPILGSWRLVAVNNLPLPAQLPSTYVVRGALTINSNVTYSLSETDSGTAGLSTVTSSGQWSVVGNLITFTDANSTVYQGTVNSMLDTVFVSFNGHSDSYAHN